jgi:hypothetical protein
LKIRVAEEKRSLYTIARTEHGVFFLREIVFYCDLEDAIGDVDKLRETKFMNAVEEILSNNPEIIKC